METEKAKAILQKYSDNIGVVQATCEKLTNSQLKEVAGLIREPERVRNHLRTVYKLREVMNASK
jgi:hypothetical protein